jgi:hypothetical protein
VTASKTCSGECGTKISVVQLLSLMVIASLLGSGGA